MNFLKLSKFMTLCDVTLASEDYRRIMVHRVISVYDNFICMKIKNISSVSIISIGGNIINVKNMLLIAMALLKCLVEWISQAISMLALLMELSEVEINCIVYIIFHCELGKLLLNCHLYIMP